MDKKEILKNRYQEYTPSPFEPKNVVAMFQKKFADEKGIKYFIDIHKYDAWTHPYSGERFPPSYEYSALLFTKGMREPVSLLFFAGWNIERVEEHVEKLFQTGMYDYYEEFGGNE